MRKARVTACDNFFSTDKDKRCNGRYCDGCIQRHYMEEATDFAHLAKWTCFRCTGRCTCAACKRRRKGDDGLPVLGEAETAGVAGVVTGVAGVAAVAAWSGASPALLGSSRKREAKRYADEVGQDDDDDDFEPVAAGRRQGLGEQHVRPPAMVRPTPPKAPRMEKRPSSMSALALLAEESLTAEFVPGSAAGADMAILEHSAEIARLKSLCAGLQQQVAAIVQRLDMPPPSALPL
jgi:hypothetical protein